MAIIEKKKKRPTEKCIAAMAAATVPTSLLSVNTMM